jgi:carbon-monoxide dehydrogenase large subunit
MNDMTTVGRFGSGRAVKRIEDEVLLAGAGRFTDDVAVSTQATLSILRSPVAHARIKSIDTTAAKALPGVLAVLTGADLVAAGVKPMPIAPIFKRADGSPSAIPLRHALAPDIVRFVGEAVVAVVAETLEQAKDALEAVTVEYEDLPVVVDMADAIKPGAPKVYADSPDNLVAAMNHGDTAASDAAFAAAAHVVSVDIDNQRLSAVPMEPRSSLVLYDAATEKFTIRLSNQMPSGAKDTLCGTLDIAPDKIRILIGDVGGGFGMKAGLYPEDMVAVFAARLLKRSVRWKAARIDEFLAAMHGRDIETHAEFALDANGKVLAYRIRTLANMGAYPNTTGVLIQLLIGPWVATSIYDIKTIDFQFSAVLTNTAPTAAYRGAGRPEAIFLTEQLFDKAARKLGLDPSEIRRRNVIPADAMPYTNAMGQTYDTGKFGSILEQGLELAKWTDFASREAASKAKGKLRGRGMASFLEWTGGNVFEERVTVAINGDTGDIEVFAATLPMGQGIATSYAQLVVDVFGVPIDKVKIVQGDTDRGAGFGSVGSRSLFTAGSAIHLASETARNTARDLAADLFEASNADIEYDEGTFRIAGTDQMIGLFDLAGRQPDKRIYVDATHSVNGPTWPNGCHVCEVEIDPDTGDTEIVSYTSVNDVGYAVNPMIVRGQLDGGAAQGIGQALGEAIVYDSSGQAMTASMMDYFMPRADTISDFTHELDTSIPCKNNPLGVKGVGELGTIGATPAVVSAIVDALTRAGQGAKAELLQMPFTPEKVWQALH